VAAEEEEISLTTEIIFVHAENPISVILLSSLISKSNIMDEYLFYHQGSRTGHQATLRIRKSTRTPKSSIFHLTQKEVYDSDSDTEDIAANCIDRLCDFVTDTEKWDDDGTLKEIYMKSDFYELYVNFNSQEQEPKFDEAEELYEETCANVFC